MTTRSKLEICKYL